LTKAALNLLTWLLSSRYLNNRWI